MPDVSDLLVSYHPRRRARRTPRRLRACNEAMYTSTERAWLVCRSAINCTGLTQGSTPGSIPEMPKLEANRWICAQKSTFKND